MDGVVQHGWEIKSISFCEYVHVPMHTCTKRQGRRVYYQGCFTASKWSDVIFSSHLVEGKLPPRVQLHLYIIFPTSALTMSTIQTLKSDECHLETQFSLFSTFVLLPASCFEWRAKQRLEELSSHKTS